MLTERIAALAAVCDEDERDLVEKMVCAAGDYVQAVVNMRAKFLNFAGRTGEDLRTAVAESDKERSRCHDALISYVDIVNRICAAHGHEPLYTGSAARSEYGDFAVKLADEIFAGRYGK